MKNVIIFYINFTPYYMGALYGYITKIKGDYRIVSEIMKTSSLYWGNDNSFVYESNFGFIGYLHRYNTPESVYEQQPYIINEQYYIFFNGRIDNRDELIKVVGLNINDNLADGFIVAKVWEKFKNKAVDYIFGDWVIVVWDEKEKQLNLLRDHHGYSALYYYKNNNFFAFATCIKSLLAIDEIPKKPNMLRVAQVLNSWQGKGYITSYEDIYRLTPGNILTFNYSFEIKVERHWFPENIKTLHYKNDDDYYSRFFEEYTRAVEQRLRSYKPVASGLSGGLDSSTVVVLAAQLLKMQGIKLSAFTSVPAYNVEDLTSKRQFGDESYFAKLTADFTGNTDWYPINAKDVNPFNTVIDGVNIHDEPFHAAANSFWTSELKRTASKMNIGTFLTGQGGNGSVSWPIESVLHKIINKREMLSLNNLAKYSFIKQIVLPSIIPTYLMNLLKGSDTNKLFFLKHSAINKDYATRESIYEQMKEDNAIPSYSQNLSAKQTRLKMIAPGKKIVGFLHAQSAAAFNMETRDPTIDIKLLEYCFSIPNHIYFKGNMDRLLIRKTFKGLLPDEVLYSTNRGKQAADIGHRVAHYYESGKTIMQQLSQSHLCREILNIELMNRILEDLKQKVDRQNNTMAGTILLRGISAGVFLRRFD